MESLMFPLRALRFVLAFVNVVVITACGAEGLPAPLDCGVAPPLFDIGGDVVQGESDAGCVRIERKTIALGDDFICKACPYEATRLIARLSDDSDDSDDSKVNLELDVRDDLASNDRDDVGALTYEASHHNWADVVTVHGDGNTTPTTFATRILYDVPNDGWNLEFLDDSEDSEDSAPRFVLPIVGSR